MRLTSDFGFLRVINTSLTHLRGMRCLNRLLCCSKRPVDHHDSRWWKPLTGLLEDNMVRGTLRTLLGSLLSLRGRWVSSPVEDDLTPLDFTKASSSSFAGWRSVISNHRQQEAIILDYNISTTLFLIDYFRGSMQLGLLLLLLLLLLFCCCNLLRGSALCHAITPSSGGHLGFF
jgi:hypothetical protein